MSTQETRPGMESYEAPQIINHENERTLSAGIALLIVGFDSARNGDNAQNPLFWTIKELESKPETKKRAGEISTPAETRKIGETRESNVLGALAEFCDDASLDYVRKHLFLAEGVFRERVININGNMVDLSVLIYDGDLDYPISPLNSTEVSPNKWLSKDQIQTEEGVRPVLGKALGQDLSEGLSSGIIETYLNHPEKLTPVFNEEFASLSEFYRNRELFIDVPLVNRTVAES